jgi:hypothetical protein
MLRRFGQRLNLHLWVRGVADSTEKYTGFSIPGSRKTLISSAFPPVSFLPGSGSFLGCLVACGLARYDRAVSFILGWLVPSGLACSFWVVAACSRLHHAHGPPTEEKGQGVAVVNRESNAGAMSALPLYVPRIPHPVALQESPVWRRARKYAQVKTAGEIPKQAQAATRAQILEVCRGAPKKIAAFIALACITTGRPGCISQLPAEDVTRTENGLSGAPFIPGWLVPSGLARSFRAVSFWAGSFLPSWLVPSGLACSFWAGSFLPGCLVLGWLVPSELARSFRAGSFLPSWLVPSGLSRSGLSSSFRAGSFLPGWLVPSGLVRSFRAGLFLLGWLVPSELARSFLARSFRAGSFLPGWLVPSVLVSSELARSFWAGLLVADPWTVVMRQVASH